MPILLAIYIQSVYPQNRYRESVRYTSVALCAVGTSVTLRYLRPLRDSVCLLYKTFSLSLHISEEPFSYRTYALNFPYIITTKTRQRIPKNSLFECLCN